ncbi:sugar phosphate isomerase/epimerase family protein [Achromobacter aloeverae]
MNRIAFTTITAGGSLAEKARAMRAAGFTATEIWARDLFEHLEGPEAALGCLEDAGLAVTALQAMRNVEGCPPGKRRLKFDIAERMMDLACLAGTPMITLAANLDPQASGAAANLVDDLGRLAELAARRGLRIAYEPIAWAPFVNTWRQGLALVEQVGHDALGLQLDAFHAFVRGLPIDLAAIPLKRLFLVEVSDLVPSGLSAREISRGHRLFPGEGSAPVRAFAQDLRRHGYAGDVVVEVFNTEYLAQDPASVIARAWRSMQPLFGPTFS